VTLLYNLCNAIMYCILAGRYHRLRLGHPPALRHPAQTKWYPEDLRFVLVCWWWARSW